MKTLHTLKVELNKTIINAGFLLSVLITIALQFTTQIYVDAESGKPYCVLEVLLQLDRNRIKQDCMFSAFRVLQAGVAGYFVMFVSIIAAFPFIPAFCEERSSGLIRFTIQRTGKLRYYTVKFISAALGGGLAILLGYVIYALLLAILFPSIYSYPLPAEEMMLYTHKFVATRLALSMLGMFLYGAVSAIPAFLMASIVRNKYIITCVPFMILYLYSSSLTKMVYDAMETRNQKRIDLGNILKPEQITTLYYGDSIAKKSLLFQTAFVILAFLLFIYSMNRRRDLGE